MAAKKSQSTKSNKSTKSVVKDFQPLRVTFGVATLAAVTIVVFAIILAVQISEY